MEHAVTAFMEHGVVGAALVVVAVFAWRLHGQLRACQDKRVDELVGLIDRYHADAEKLSATVDAALKARP